MSVQEAARGDPSWLQMLNHKRSQVGQAHKQMQDNEDVRLGVQRWKRPRAVEQRQRDGRSL